MEAMRREGEEEVTREGGHEDTRHLVGLEEVIAVGDPVRPAAHERAPPLLRTLLRIFRLRRRRGAYAAAGVVFVGPRAVGVVVALSVLAAGATDERQVGCGRRTLARHGGGGGDGSGGGGHGRGGMALARDRGGGGGISESIHVAVGCERQHHGHGVWEGK